MNVIDETQNLKVRTPLEGKNFPKVSPYPLGKEALFFNFNVNQPKATFGDEEFNPNIQCCGNTTFDPFPPFDPKSFSCQYIVYEVPINNVESLFK